VSRRDVARRAGAGFYAAKLGPLPFVIGKVPPERYRIFEVIARVVPPEHVVN
jgi:hypothetical protein